MVEPSVPGEVLKGQVVEKKDVILSIRGLKKVYRFAGGEVHALRGVDLEVRRGETVAVVGASGVGKSTLLHVVGTLDRPTSGEVFFQGERLFRRSDKELAAFRNRSLGFVFQFHHLLPEFTALENVMIPGLLGAKPRKSVEKQARDLIERVGLGNRAHHRPAELSGGEQQRVAVARALVNSPALLLADEPTGNLDTETSERLSELMREVALSYGLTSVVVTHNASIAEKMDRVVTMVDGKIIGLGKEG